MAALPDIDALRARLAGPEGPTLWRSLDAVADTPAFRHFLEAEFPAAQSLAAGPDRREVLRLMAASFAMAGLAACDADDGRVKEVPYVRQPERIQPGAALTYASTALLDGIGSGILVTTRNGRPLKIEGNEAHPWSRGGTDAFAQASILDLWNPARSQTVRNLGRVSTWQAFRGVMVGRFAALKAAGGTGLHLLIGPVTSPSLLDQIERMRADFPGMTVYRHAPVSRDAAYESNERVFGRRLETRHSFADARCVVAFEGDLLDPGPMQVGTSRQFEDARREAAAQGELLTLFSAASAPSLTSAKADRRLVVEPGDVARLVADLAAAVTTPAVDLHGSPRGRWIAEAAAALRRAPRRSLVTAGLAAPDAVQDAVRRLNASLATPLVTYTRPLLPALPGIADLAAAMRAGTVDTLLMLDTDPAYTAPADLGFAEALQAVRMKVHAGLDLDATASHVDWHLPLAHPLESWGDARAPDGTVGLMQPVIAPLYNGRSAAEILSLLTDAEPRDGRTLLETYWRGGADADVFAPRWRQALQDGVVPETTFMAETVTPVPSAPAPSEPDKQPGGLSILFRPDATVWDGSRAGNGWLQELPKPLTKITWGNAVAVSPALAAQEGLAQGDVVSVSAGGRSVEGPVWILPGLAPSSIVLTLGYGHAAQSTLAPGLGYDAFRLRTADTPWHLPGGTLAKTGRRERFATTQNHSTLEGHALVRVLPVGASPTVADEVPPASFYDRGKPFRTDEARAWGMAIDLDACIGCNACVVACQAENNIPIVGRDQVAAGREMHWLRIDRYYSDLKGGTGLDDPDTHFQPVPCMHCEEAPCEVGCPVEATLHDHEGLNLMVYNRCVGTRACSGYCPYKVRHFNYLDYTDPAASVAEGRNPEVTVRAKGVMEKCTYCVQRIAAARIEADRTNSPIPDGAVQTACQGACPTRAITFGDLADHGSAVAAARADSRNYALLGELNLKPRTTYLAERAPPRAPSGAGPG